MSRKSISVVLLMVILNLSISFQTIAQTGDETTFISVAPDALIILDLSGSMDWNPAGGNNIWSNSDSCTGPFYSSSSGHPYNCSRLEIAKRALFAVLNNDSSDNVINSNDSNSLGVRIGYMRFYDASSEASNGIVRRRDISALGSTAMGTPYQTIFCGAGSTGSCSAPTNAGTCSTNAMNNNTDNIVNACANGGTPLTQALKNAKTYLDTHKNADIYAKTCRQKFVILITDGADTYACSGNGSECQGHMYKRRRAVVAATKQLADAGYKVFLIGLGSTMPSYLLNTLNWMAYYGGTVTDPLITPPIIPAYNIPNGCQASTPVTSECCIDMTSNAYAAACYPSGVSNCADSPAQTADCETGGNTLNFRANNNDPGYMDLTGYAFIASDATQMNTALKNVIQQIGASSYSFSQASIQTVRTVDENYLYESTFVPLRTPNADSFWPGSLKRYAINGAIIESSTTWDAGMKLKLQGATDRHIYTYKSGAIKTFDTANVSTTDLGLTGSTATAMQAMTINFIRGGEQSGAYQNWKLGDIFHSSPITIGTPSENFYDKIDQNNPTAFMTFQSDTNHLRTTASGKRLIVAGANDGQFHIFKAANWTDGGGTEIWSFVPPNFLPRLPSIAHSSHPVVASCVHQYFVDGPTSAYDVWLQNGDTKIAKLAANWHTLLVISEGRGGASNLWSSSASCDSGFSDTYSTTTGNIHYCGYWAFDLTNTTATTPTFQWKLGGTAGLSLTDGSHFGQPWSKMMMGRVNVSGDEKWVGFIGGGYSATSGTAGRGFYVVNAGDGTIRWSYTQTGNDVTMLYALPGTATIIDSNNDGFIDKAYIGDMGGNIWRFRFCPSDASCTWSGGKFFNSTVVRPIFTKPVMTIDKYGKLWVYFGTGNVNDPNNRTTTDVIYAVKDLGSATPYSTGNLSDISASGTVYDPTVTTTNGWYITLSQGEKILADPSLYAGNLYFTTYTPPDSSSTTESRDCRAGAAAAYCLNYLTGAGCWSDGQRSIAIGFGVPGSVQGSFLRTSAGQITNTLNLYVTSSEGVSGKNIYNGGIGDSLTDLIVNTNPVGGGGGTPFIYWRDRRIQP
jgi:hypothetical protein